MSCRVDRETRRALAVVVSATTLLLVAPLAAVSGVTVPTPPAASSPGTTPPAATAPPSRADSKRPTYQLRCWQYGRLVFEENGVRFDFSDDQRRLRGTDRDGQDVIVTETANATCLLRAERDKRPDPALGR